MQEKKFTVRVLTEIAIFAALGFALDLLQSGMWRGVFFNGGSIGLACIPILIISYRRGLLPGLLCGFILSIVQMLGGVYALNSTNFDNAFMQAMGPFLQVMLDYVLAYTVVGFAGIFSRRYKDANTFKMKVVWICAGCLLGGLLKYLCHVLSGGLFWMNYGSVFWNIDDTTWLYTFIYNGAFSIPNIIISICVLILIAKFYNQFLNPTEKFNEKLGENNEKHK